MKRRPGTPIRALRLGQHAGRVRLEVAAQAEFLPRQHDRRAVFTDRAAHEHAIAGPHPVEAETDAGRRKPIPVAAR